MSVIGSSWATGTWATGTWVNESWGAYMLSVDTGAIATPPSPTVDEEVALTGPVVSGGTEPYSYAWSIVSDPEGSTATLSATTKDTTFTPDAIGEYTLRCTVTDDVAASVTSDVVVTAQDPAAPGSGLRRNLFGASRFEYNTRFNFQ